MLGRANVARSYSVFFQKSKVPDEASFGLGRRVLYQGPLNGYMRKLKRNSTIGTGLSLILAPLALRYLGNEDWSFASNMFFLSGVGAAALGQFYLINRTLGEYVLRVHGIDQQKELKTENQQENPNGENLSDRLIELETMDWIGRTEKRVIFSRDLEILSPNLMASKTLGRNYYFCPNLLSKSSLISQIPNKL